jgi:hypothetical protein
MFVRLGGILSLDLGSEPFKAGSRDDYQQEEVGDSVSRKIVKALSHKVFAWK